MPIMLMTPTRKVNFETNKYSGINKGNLIIDSCKFLQEIRKQYPNFGEKIFIGGLLGCKGDAYQSEGALDVSVSYAFHSYQVSEFTKGKVDFLFAGIMPALTETIGIARAMAESCLPYIISFMVRNDGCLLDGTGIAEAIKIIDNEVNPKPICYMANCVHPSNLKMALDREINRDSPYLRRFAGIQANSSPLSPEELNNNPILQVGNFDEMVSDIYSLIKKYDFNVMGGCCGTNEIFIEKLAIMLQEFNKTHKI
jgi:S-methylmethionine-dependent homocysteine/selenocysteine methylase